ncbi:MAG TPA: DoxX family protein [Labilithrix sp.]|nr:DoxX family protein [Labilithrix sp.]
MNARTLLASAAPRSVVLIRAAVSIVFVSEGIQKFLYPDALGAGRFATIGIPSPGLMGPFVGGVEVACGLLVLVGLVTRLAAVPLMIDMLVAIASTKLPIMLGHGYWLFANPTLSRTGGWSMLHEARTDLSMLLGAGFLVLAGAGPLAADAWLLRRRAPLPVVEETTP